MEWWLRVVIYANWIGFFIWAALVVIVRWAEIDVFSLSLTLKSLILAVIALAIALTVANVILYNAVERRYEKESE